jgi:hypothetical protein
MSNKNVYIIAGPNGAGKKNGKVKIIDVSSYNSIIEGIGDI